MSRTETSSPPDVKVKTRRLRLPARHWYNPLTWRRRVPLPPRRPISSTWQLMRQATHLLKKDLRTFGGITLVYAVGVLIFVRSFSVSSAETTTTTGATSFGAKLSAGLNQLNALVQSGTDSLSAASSVYQLILSTVCCLAIIWTAREILSAQKTSTKASFYQGMRPLVPYVLVTAMMGVYLIPIAVGGYLYSTALSLGVLSGLASYIALLLFILLATWSTALFLHGLFALFIVTLPKMAPIAAIKNAKKMVLRRRLLVVRKILLAAMIIMVMLAVIMLPFIVWLPAVAPWVFYLLTVCIVTYSELFLYVLYREML